MSLGNVYHCTYEHSPWIILAQHGVIYFIHIIIIIIIIFGHTLRGVLDSDLISIRYYTLILLWIYFACWHHRIIAS